MIRRGRVIVSERVLREHPCLSSAERSAYMVGDQQVGG